MAEKNGRRRKIERYSWRDLAISDLTWWYWLASGYGERIGRAALGLVCIWLLFAATFTIVGFVRWEPKTATQAEATSATFDSYGAPLTFRRALTYSGAVITLQRPEPKPATAIARTAVLFQTILGPIQAALLALRHSTQIHALGSSSLNSYFESGFICRFYKLCSTKELNSNQADECVSGKNASRRTLGSPPLGTEV